MASFHNSSTQFLHLHGVLSLVSSNFSKLSDSRVKIQIHFSLFERFARVFNFLGFSPLGGFNFLGFHHCIELTQRIILRLVVVFNLELRPSEGH